MEHADLEARPEKGVADPAARYRDASGDVALPAAAAGRAARWPARRSHRRHCRLQRAALPDLGVLRPRQAEREPSGLLTGPRTLPPWVDGGCDHAGLAALRDDAGEFRRHRNELARGADGAGRRPASGAAGFRAVGIAALYRPRPGW